MNKNKEENKQLTASQRLAGLEVAVQSLDQALYNSAVQADKIQQALKLTVQRQEAVINLLKSGTPVTEENINADIVRQKADDLKDGLEQLKKKGLLVQSEEANEKSFLVTREMDKKGNVLDPRVQFTTNSLTDQMKGKVLGKKVGESIEIDGNEESFLEIEEIYEIVTPEIKLEKDQQEQPAN